MRYCILISLLSLFLENICNIYLSNFKYFIPLFTILSLIFVYPYLSNNKKYYLLYSFFLGLIYDLFFTNFYILNSIIFVLCGYFIYYIFKRFNYSLLTIIITTIFVIFFYNIFCFCILNFFLYTNYSLIEFSIILRYFIILNLIYSLFMYLIIKVIKNK